MTVTLSDRLLDLAKKTEQRIGNHPDADLLREAAAALSKPEPRAAPKAPTRSPK